MRRRIGFEQGKDKKRMSFFSDLCIKCLQGLFNASNIVAKTNRACIWASARGLGITPISSASGGQRRYMMPGWAQHLYPHRIKSDTPLTMGLGMSMPVKNSCGSHDLRRDRLVGRVRFPRKGG